MSAEPPLDMLRDAGFITPTALQYVHNHGPVPKLSWDTHSLTVTTPNKTRYAVLLSRPEYFVQLQHISKTSNFSCLTQYFLMLLGVLVNCMLLSMFLTWGTFALLNCDCCLLLNSEFRMSKLKSMVKQTLPVTLIAEGNRRKELCMIKPTKNGYVQCCIPIFLNLVEFLHLTSAYLPFCSLVCVGLQVEPTKQILY